MDSKNYTQVLIDGKIYTLGGSEDEGYLQRAASYVNEKVNTLRRIPGFTKQSVEYQTVMAELNMADDYFKAMEHSREVEHQRDELERETYSLKHELVSTQMKLEVVLKDLEERQRELEELTREKHRLERKLRGAAKNRGDQEAAASALRVRDESSEKNSSGRESGHTSPVKAGDKGDDDDDGAGHGEARFVAEAEDWEVESAGEEQAEDAEEPEKIELADDVEESEEIGESEDVEKSEEIELADDVEELEFAVTGERAEVLEPETAGAEDTASDLPEAQSDKAKSTAAELPESIRPVLAGGGSGRFRITGGVETGACRAGGIGAAGDGAVRIRVTDSRGSHFCPDRVCEPGDCAFRGSGIRNAAGQGVPGGAGAQSA